MYKIQNNRCANRGQTNKNNISLLILFSPISAIISERILTCCWLSRRRKVRIRKKLITDHDEKINLLRIRSSCGI